MRKFIVYLLAALLLCVLLVFIALRFFPKTYVSAVNYFLPENAVVEQLDVRFFPLSVVVGNLNVQNVDGASFFTLKEAAVSAQVMGWAKGKNNFWKVDANGIDIQMLNLPQTEASEDETESTSDRINVHQMLSLLNVNVGQVNIAIDEQQSLTVNLLNTRLNDDDLSDFKLVEQSVDFSADYSSGEQGQAPLHLEGQLISRFKDGVSLVELTVPELDASPLISLDQDGDAEEASQAEADGSEEAIDWSWMSSIESLSTVLKVGQIKLSDESSIDDLVLSLSLTDKVTIESQANINWLDSEEFGFQDAVALSGEWQPIMANTVGADLNGELSLATSALNVIANGNVNVNGSNDNALLLDIQATEVPLSLPLDDETSELVEQYFPVKVNANVEMLADLIDLKINQANFGESDIAVP